MPTCKGCGQEIKWVKTPAGKNMPLDPKPVKMVEIVSRLSDADVGIVVDVYMPHWATCSKAEQFKKG